MPYAASGQVRRGTLERQPAANTQPALVTIREARIALNNHMSYATRGQVRRSRSRANVFNFGDEMRAWRHKHNFSQSEAALKLQISKRTLQEWEQGRTEPEGLARIAILKIVR